MNEKEAAELLSWYAFKTVKVDPCYQNILNRVVAYTFGLPLALEIIGSSLCGKKIEEWDSALDQYQRIPDKDILDRLKVSYDSLREVEQNIFLDIACFFKGSALSYVQEILYSHHGFCPDYAIGVLIDKSLVKITCGDVTLHDLIEDMGKEIVRKESQEPGKRSRLWCSEDIVEVLEENKGTSRIGMIVLDRLKNEVVNWDGVAFKEMTNLRTLIIRDGIFTNGPKHLPRSLRVLEWPRYPSRSLPFEFHPKKLVISLVSTKILCSTNQIWEIFWNQMKRGTILPECSKLMWRACQNRLPVRASKVTENPMCPMCGEAVETIVHALITCPEVRQVWFASPLCLRIDPSSVTDFSQWIYTLFERCDDEIVELVCTLLWSIWNRRNQWVNKFIRVTVSQVITEATNIMIPKPVSQVITEATNIMTTPTPVPQVITEATNIMTIPKPVPVVITEETSIMMIPKRVVVLTETDCPLVIWKPSPFCDVMANFSVLVKKGRGTGMGVVFRDKDGDILEAATHFRLDCMKVTIAEALCFRWVLQLAEESYSRRVVVIESDCHIAEEMLNGEYVLTEVRREANLLAVKLASLAFVYHQDMLWTRDIPHEAHPVAIMDALAYNSCLSRKAPVKWAQRSDVLYITVKLADAKDVKLKLKPEGKFYFSATAGAEKINYELDINLFDNIDINNSKARAGSRNICCLVKKAKNKWWRGLLKHSGYRADFLRKDWDKWVDEDETAYEMDFGDIDFSMLNMGGGEGLDFDAAGNDDIVARKRKFRFVNTMSVTKKRRGSCSRSIQDDGSDTEEEVSFCSDDWSDTEEGVTAEA